MERDAGLPGVTNHAGPAVHVSSPGWSWDRSAGLRGSMGQDLGSPQVVEWMEAPGAGVQLCLPVA